MSSPPVLSPRGRLAVPAPISELMARALAHPQLISLAAGFVDQLSLPAERTAAALARVWEEVAQARAALQYGTTLGHPPLRQEILARSLAADKLSSDRRPVPLERVLLTAGSNQLLHLAAEILCAPGDIVLCAAPTYFVFLGTLAGMGVRAIGVAADEQGLRLDALEERLASLKQSGELPRVKGIYVVSEFDNPRGTTFAPARRAELVALAERWSTAGKIYILEDAAYRELRYSGESSPSIWSHDERGDTVVYAGTFSKSFSPGVRVGWGILPEALAAPVANFKGNVDFGSPNFNQHLMAAVLAGGEYEPHTALLRETYRGKLQATLAAAEEHLRPIAGVRWQAPEGGLYLWLELPAGLAAGPGGRLFDLALEEGVLYVPGEYAYPAEGEPPRRDTIRLSFGVQTPERIAAGIAALARAIRRAC